MMVGPLRKLSLSFSFFSFFNLSAGLSPSFLPSWREGVSAKKQIPAISQPPRRSRRSSATMRWQSVYSQIEVPVTADAAYNLYVNLDRHPEWSLWLREVQYDSALGESKWVLATRGVTVDWRARNTAVEQGQRIAWEATSGLPNRGEVTFTPLGPDRAEVSMSISYDAPAFVTVLVSNVGVLRGFIERTLLADLRRFREVLVCEVERGAPEPDSRG
mmetsp:Transcript_24095/g.54380  ORF Transcript_24095/g.54380 Transcript_24095/m.54380 type:complete len:216 (-) Transcript_24095:330-977(-)